LAVTDWRLRRWRLWFLALMTPTRVTRNLKMNGTFCATQSRLFGVDSAFVLKAENVRTNFVPLLIKPNRRFAAAKRRSSNARFVGRSNMQPNKAIPERLTR